MTLPTLAERCRIHAAKMDGEGWYVTANVLEAAAAEIETLRGKIRDQERAGVRTADLGPDAQPAYSPKPVEARRADE